MTSERAREVLAGEARRLRSGAGGHGGRSVAALELAEAIEVLLAELPLIASRG
jgi:hypothetical protein